MASTAAAAVSIWSYCCYGCHVDLVSSNSGVVHVNSSSSPLSLSTKSRPGISGRRPSAGLTTLSGDGGRRRRRRGLSRGGDFSVTGLRRMLTPTPSSSIRCGENEAQMSTEGCEDGEPTTFGTVFEPNRNFPETPPEWKEKEAARVAEMMEKEGISIRRHPGSGPPLHNCGAFQFKLQNDGNTPTNILEEIVWYKDVEVTQMKEKTPLPALMTILKTVKPTRDFIGALRERGAQTSQPALIAEVKKASPSRGVIQPNFDPVRIARAYESGGAACLSVLTDSKYFQGSFENLRLIRGAGVKCPLLCKEFIIDAWQLFYARAHGADAVLLIAAVLCDQDLRYFSKIAKSLGMAVLIEVHNHREMGRVLALPDVKMIGINNRNLATFKVDLHNTVQLLEGDHGRQISERGILVVGESGLFTPADIKVVRDVGVHAVLVGESLVKQEDPVAGIKGLFGQDISQTNSTSKSELEVATA